MSGVLNQALSGPKYDFDSLCTPHYKALVNYANRLLPGRPQEARDLVQETFLRAMRAWEKWSPSTNEDPSGAARGWLHRILQNLFFCDARARAGHRRKLDDNHDSVVSNTYGVDNDHDTQELSDGVGDEVRQALEDLDPDQRDVVMRADFGGEQYLTIAENLGIPLGTVMSRLHRGRKRLSVSLKDYAKDEYGIYRKGTRRQLARGSSANLDSAGATALADVAPEAPEADADCIDGVVARDDGSDLFEG